MDVKTLLPILLAVFVMASFFLTWLSTKTWRGAHVAMVFLVFVGALVFWYLAAATLKLHKTYREQAIDLENKLKEATGVAAALREGTEEEQVKADVAKREVQLVSGGIKAMERELAGLLSGRGRTWTDVEVARPGPDGTVAVTLNEAPPHGVEQDMVLFVFKQGNVAEGARYLGEFRVAQVNEAELTLQPTMVLTDRQLKQLTDAEAPWVLYELMPVDRTDVLASLTDAELEELMPAASIDEYKKNGKPAGPDDPPLRVQLLDEPGGKQQRVYARELRDYETLFHELYRQRYVAINTQQQRVDDQALLQDALDSAKKDVAYRTEELEKLKVDEQGTERDRDVVAAYLTHLTGVYERLRARLAARFAQNNELAAELAQIQAELTRQINSRTSEPMAQATPATTVAAP